MNFTIINTPLHLNLHGYSGIAADRDYMKAIFPLMDQMWKEVKGNNIANKGQNIWVYESGHAVFAGVELTQAPPPACTLEHKTLSFPRYAYYKHFGPYHLLRQVSQELKDVMKQQGYEPNLPCVEIYGHWTPDESKLETELIFSFR